MVIYDPTTVRLQLLDQGYSPIPLWDKTPNLGDWNGPAYANATADDIRSWEIAHKWHKTTGLLVCNGLMPIDFDISDEGMMDQMQAELERLVPAVCNSPWRTGKFPKLMVFTRWAPSKDWPNMFSREASSKFIDGDGKQHFIEVFGGRPTALGKPSKQVAVAGVHTYKDDKPWKKVLYEYSWEPGPTLMDVRLEDLPIVTPAQMWELLRRFDEAAKARGWSLVLPTTSGKGNHKFVYDITELTRFNVENGPSGASYAELCAMEGDDDLRVDGSFIDGSASRTDKCRVGYCRVRQAVGVYDTEGGAWHLPEALKPAGSNEELMERLKALLGDTPSQPTGPQRPPHPKAEAPIEEKAKWLFDTKAYCENEYSVVDIYEPSGICQVAPKAFQMMYRPWRDIGEGKRGGKVVVTAAGAWEIYPARKNVAGVRMRPDQDFPLYEENGQFYKNTYLRPVHVNAGGDVKPLLTFLERFLPDPFERTWLLNWMAHKMRRPDIPGTAVVFVADDEEDVENGRFGTGRGMLFRMATKLFGEQYTRAQSFGIVSGTSSQSTYNDWIQGSVLIMVDEAKTASTTGHRRAERNSVYEILKDTVDPAPKRMRVNPKGRQAYDSVSFASFWIATNHRNAMAIPRDDRRFTVLRNGRPMAVEERAVMAAWLDNDANIGALAAFLETMDLAGFDMLVPLDTIGKADMAELALSDVDELMIEMAEDPTLGLVFTKQQMETKVQEYLGINGVRWHGEFAAAWPTHCIALKNEKGTPRRTVINKKQRKLYCFRRNLQRARAAPEAALARQAAKWGGVDPIVDLYNVTGSSQKDE